MIFTIEISRPAIAPGRFRSTLGGRPFRRVWCLWFALSWWPGDAKDYGDAIRDGCWLSPQLRRRR